MNAQLKGLLASKKSLNNLVTLNYRTLSDKEMRYIAQKAIEAGYATLYDIPDAWAEETLRMMKQHEK